MLEPQIFNRQLNRQVVVSQVSGSSEPQLVLWEATMGSELSRVRALNSGSEGTNGCLSLRGLSSHMVAYGIFFKADLWSWRFRRSWRRIEDLHDPLKDVYDRRLMDIQPSLQLLFEGSELFGQGARVTERRPHFYERPNHEYTHLNRLRAVQNVRGHNRAVFGESAGKDRRESQTVKVVTICDHLGFFAIGEKESEIVRETIDIALYSLVQRLRRNAINLSHVGIQDNSLVPNCKDALFERYPGDYGQFSFHADSLDSGTYSTNGKKESVHADG